MRACVCVFFIYGIYVYGIESYLFFRYIAYVDFTHFFFFDVSLIEVEGLYASRTIIYLFIHLFLFIFFIYLFNHLFIYLCMFIFSTFEPSLTI